MGFRAALNFRKFKVALNSMYRIFLEVASEEEIIEICGTCRAGTAVGHDNISMNLIKDSIDY